MREFFCRMRATGLRVRIIKGCRRVFFSIGSGGSTLSAPCTVTVGDTGEVAATSTSQISRSLLIDNAFTVPGVLEGAQELRGMMTQYVER
ncbi:hypothetical protein HMPREF2944_00780 [Rothia sp. HMSC072E10]|nr:hypothetical protein HMPREF2944_00780 [Rothia sp. HMSC072E10]